MTSAAVWWKWNGHHVEWSRVKTLSSLEKRDFKNSKCRYTAVFVLLSVIRFAHCVIHTRFTVSSLYREIRRHPNGYYTILMAYNIRRIQPTQSLPCAQTDRHNQLNLLHRLKTKHSPSFNTRIRAGLELVPVSR